MNAGDKERMKRRKPSFTRQDSHKKRLASGWRRPKGLHSKMRLQFKGYKRIVKVGYGTPVALRHTHHGKPIIRITSLKDVAALPNDCAVILSATLGLRKRKALLEALPQQLTVLNASLDAVKKKIQERKPIPASQPVEKKEVKPPQQKKKQEQQLSEEEKKQQEKKELDKLLIHTE